MFGIYIITDNISYLRTNLEADSLNHHQDGKVLQQNLHSKVVLKKPGLGVLENSQVNIPGMFYLKKISNLTMMQSTMNIFVEIFKNFKKNYSFDKMYTTSTNRTYKPRKGYFVAFFEYIAITKSVAILWNRNILKYMTQRFIQNTVKYLRRSFMLKQMFYRVLHIPTWHHKNKHTLLTINPTKKIKKDFSLKGKHFESFVKLLA